MYTNTEYQYLKYTIYIYKRQKNKKQPILFRNKIKLIKTASYKEAYYKITHSTNNTIIKYNIIQTAIGNKTIFIQQDTIHIFILIADKRQVQHPKANPKIFLICNGSYSLF